MKKTGGFRLNPSVWGQEEDSSAGETENEHTEQPLQHKRLPCCPISSASFAFVWLFANKEMSSNNVFFPEKMEKKGPKS